MVREGNADLVGKIIFEITKRFQEIFTEPLEEFKLPALILMEILSLMTIEELQAQIPKYIGFLHLEMSSKNPSNFQVASRVLGIY